MPTTDNKQLCFDFMNEMPEQLSPAAKRRDLNCLRAVCAKQSSTPNLKGGGHGTTQTKRPKELSTSR